MSTYKTVNMCKHLFLDYFDVSITFREKCFGLLFNVFWYFNLLILIQGNVTYIK